MPAISLFNRRLQLGSDDFVVPSLCGFFFRVLWFSMMITIYLLSNWKCSSTIPYQIYLIGSLIIFAVSGVLDILRVIYSLKGTIMDDVQRRWPITVIMYINVGMFALEIIWTIMGTYWSLSPSLTCLDPLEPNRITMGFTVAMGWVYIVFISVTLFCLSSVRCSGYAEDDKELTAKLWAERMSLLFCCAGVRPHESQVFTEVGQILAELMYNSDLVPSDIASGLVLLYHQQLLMSKRGPPKSTALIREDKRVPLSTLVEASYYMTFCLGSYGWPLYLYMRGPGGLCDMPCSPVGCSETVEKEGEKNKEVQYDGDNCMGWNATALQQQLNQLSEGDIDVIYANFSNPLYQMPYFVAVDHAKRVVVVSIRGTMSLRDCLVDVICEDHPVKMPNKATVENRNSKHSSSPSSSSSSSLIDLDEESERDKEPDDCIYVHKGIWFSAQSIFKDLKTKGIISKLRDLPRTKYYSWCLVGHSLGAGIAALLSIIFKQEMDDLVLTCWSFSPPGGLMSLKGALYCKEWINSVIVGDDMIPRLSRASVEGVYDRMIAALNKYQSSKFNALCCLNGSNLDDLPSEHSNLVTQQETLFNAEGDFVVDMHITNRGTRRLYPPGNIIWLTKTQKTGQQEGQEEEEDGDTFVPVESDNTLFPDIIVSQGMMVHHLPDFVHKVLCETVTNYDSMFL